MHTTHSARLGLALSGAAARSAFYLGFLEVLQEENIPVAVIAAQSGASLVAASYACGTLERLKKDLFALDWGKLRQLLKRSSRGGLYSLEIAEEYFRNHLTLGKRFEDLDTKLCFSATDLDSGRLVPLAMGDVAHSIRITCSVPGLFEPVAWGNQVLVDGGILSVIPAHMAREAGADVVVGVSVRSTKHIFLPSHIKLKRAYNTVREFLSRHVWLPVGRFVRKAVSPDGFESEIEAEIETLERAGYSLIKAVSRSLDLAVDVTQEETTKKDKYVCDLFIGEGEGKYGDSVNISKSEGLYRAGRDSALLHVGAIRDLLEKKTADMAAAQVS
jgi:predicted acylesterase/phospholipase RssA